MTVSSRRLQRWHASPNVDTAAHTLRTFPEDILVESLRPENCIAQLLQELEPNTIVTDFDLLRVDRSQSYPGVRGLFCVVQLNQSWSNARDVKNLAKQMLGRLFELMGEDCQETRTLFIYQVVEYMV